MTSALKPAESLLWKVQEQHITASGAPVSAAQPGESERAQKLLMTCEPSQNFQLPTQGALL